MSEITIAYMTDEFGFSRRKATAINIVIAMLFGTLCALSFGSLSEWTICGMTIFNLFDYVSSNILLPVGGMIISIFGGWVLDRSVGCEELITPDSSVRPWMVTAVITCLRYIATLCIGLVFIYGLI